MWVVTDIEASGLIHRSRVGRTDDDLGDGPEAHDPEADAAAEAEAEERREERRRVIAYNKAWASAETVRREWLAGFVARKTAPRSEEHTSELQSLMRISYAVFCLKKPKHQYRSNYDIHVENRYSRNTSRAE